MSQTKDNIIEVKNLCVHFPKTAGLLNKVVATNRALDDISLEIERGKILGVVGESGCGKTTLGRTIMKIIEFINPDVKLSGTIELIDKDGSRVEINKMSNKEFKPYRKHVQMVFQDPQSSLNPRMIVKDIIQEPLDIHFGNKKSPDFMPIEKREERVAFLMEKVGLTKEQMFRYPHEFSGGQRQRIVIARALSTNPSVIIADEPVSALDVSIQAQVINLMKDIQKEFNLTLVFIAHDLSVVEYISDQIVVMYLGDIVETGTSDEICFAPRHPYTRSLISSIPIADPANKNVTKIKLQGEIPSPLNKPSGCAFRLRCPIARESCAKEKPTFHKEAGSEHKWACPHEADWAGMEDKMKKS